MKSAGNAGNPRHAAAARGHFGRGALAVLVAIWTACSASHPTPQPSSPRSLSGKLAAPTSTSSLLRDAEPLPDQVIAEGTDGSRVTAGVDAATGEFRITLLTSEVYVVRFASTEGGTETTASTLLFESSPGGALTALLPMSRAPDGSLADVDLGVVSIRAGQALPERNPLAQVDANGDGTSDLEDPNRTLFIEDNFDDGVLDLTLWATVYRRPGGSVEERDGHLRLTAAPLVAAQTALNSISDFHEATGRGLALDFDLMELVSGAEGSNAITELGLRTTGVILHLVFEYRPGDDEILVDLDSQGGNGFSPQLLRARFKRSEVSTSAPVHFRLEANDLTYALATNSPSFEVLNGAPSGSHGRTPIPNLDLRGLHIGVSTLIGPADPPPGAVYDNVRVAEPGY